MKYIILLLIILTQCAWNGNSWVSDQEANNITMAGHLQTKQSTAPVASSCGTSPSVATNSADMSGTITVGTGSTTTCNIAFANQYPSNPQCFLINRTLNPYITAMTVTADSTALFIKSQTNLQQAQIGWACIANTQ